MMRDLRTEKEDTPEGRIAAAAFMILDEIIVRFARSGTGPARPDRADFRDGLALYVQREIIQAKLDVVKQHGTFPQAIDLQKQLDAVNFRIAQRENPPT